MGDGIWVVVLGDVAMGLGPRWSSFGCCGLSRAVTWGWASGALVTGRWSSLLRGPWQPLPVRVFRGQEGEGNGRGDSPGGHGYW